MARRTSNRQARRLLYVPIAGYGECFKISSRRWQVYSLNYPFVWQHVKPSRSQKRAGWKLVTGIGWVSPSLQKQIAEQCDGEIYKNGISACLIDIPKHTAEEICRGVSAAAGIRVDWHYIGGRVHIKAIKPAPPLPVVSDDCPDAIYEMCCQMFDDPNSKAMEIWNACRAAMLQPGKGE